MIKAIAVIKANMKALAAELAEWESSSFDFDGPEYNGREDWEIMADMEAAEIEFEEAFAGINGIRVHEVEGATLEAIETASNLRSARKRGDEDGEIEFESTARATLEELGHLISSGVVGGGEEGKSLVKALKALRKELEA